MDERLRLERNTFFGTKVHLLAVEGHRLLQLGYRGRPDKAGWAIYTDFDSREEAKNGLRLLAEDLERTGFHQTPWVAEAVMDDFVAQLGPAGT